MFNSTNIDVTSPRQFVGTQGKTKEYDKDESNTVTYTKVEGIQDTDYEVDSTANDITNISAKAGYQTNYKATTKMAWIADENGNAVAAAGNVFHPAVVAKQ